MPITKKTYLERKLKHLCTRCGQVAKSDKTLCAYHLKQASKNQKAVFARRKQKGLCPKCGKTLMNNRKTCNECLNIACYKERKDVWRTWADRADLGLCVACGESNSTSHKWCLKCSEKYRLTERKTRKRRIENGLCGACGKGLLLTNKKRCVICIHKRKIWWASSDCKVGRAERNKLLKNRIIQHYGGKCSCCGETERTFLAIDHIDGGGNKHRKHINKSCGKDYYEWIIEQNFPDRLQILCHNCNMSKYLCGGTCAHKFTTTGV